MKAALALLLASSLVAVTAAEVALRWMRPQWAITHPPSCFYANVFQEWPAYGYRLWPSRTIAAPDGSATFHANAAGFRARREVDARDARPRIVVLGDSMVFGVGVEEEARFTELLEAAEPGWRVDNLGMIGFGPDLMLRALEAVGLDPPPAAVVLAMFTDDFRRVVPPYQGAGFALPRYVRAGDGLATVPYPAPRLWDRSRILQGVNYLRWRYTPATFALNGAILERFLGLGRERRFAPGLLFLPGPHDRWDDRMRRRWLAEFAAQHGVPFLDLTDAMLAAAARTYLPADSHWSAEGHRVAAHALRPFLTRLLAEADRRLP